MTENGPNIKMCNCSQLVIKVFSPNWAYTNFMPNSMVGCQDNWLYVADRVTE